MRTKIISQQEVIHFESELRAADNTPLYFQGWLPKHQTPETVETAVGIVHGLGEHSGRHEDTAKRLAENSIAGISFDLRGHGRSGGRRGDTPSYDMWMQDIRSFLNGINGYAPKANVILYGHSLGGNLVLNYILRNSPAIKGAIVTSPALELAFKVPLWKRAVEPVMLKIAPGFIGPNGLKRQHLSRDANVAAQYKKDPLVHNRISVRAYRSFMDAGQYALNHSQDWSGPLLLMHGSGDRITSPEASQRFAELLGDNCHFKLWQGHYHELHNEKDKDVILTYILDWLKQLD